jgi:hypothetical protein
MVNPPVVKALACPGCGAAITLRAGQLAQVVVCGSCHAVLDARDPNLAILQKNQEKLTVTPVIPLGTRGTLDGDPYEAIGFQVRSITADGEEYFWREYVLWNPYKGFRYLSEYDGHWNDITITKNLPTETMSAGHPCAEFHGDTYRLFQTAPATTRFILGEFPWQVRSGDRVLCRDFVSPPHMLSEEVTKDEKTWSIGTYTAPERIWKAFSLPGKAPAPRGIFENQPDDYSSGARELAGLFSAFAALLVLVMVARFVFTQPATVFQHSYSFVPPGSDSGAFVTPIFPITGRTSNVEVGIAANVSNSWAYFNLALINEQTGRAIDFGREVSYYSGSDEDGFWSEGGTNDRSFLPSVPAGSYFLRVQPEGPAADRRTIAYSITLRRDVPRASFYLIALGLLAVVPAAAMLRMGAFESMRWKESDYAGGGSSRDDDDDHDAFKGTA